MSNNPRVEQLLEELLEFGGTPDEACRLCPELLPQVRARWQRLRAVKAEVGVLFPPAQVSDGANSHLPTADLPRIHGHEVREVLGRGGMGVVYKAWHCRLQRPVAVKMLLAGAYAQSQELERFLREAETVAGLRHANIVQVHEAGDVDGRPYFTMEFVEGGSLAQQLAGTPQPARQAAALVAAVAEAVHAAHQRGIVHRDLKPGNILLTADGTPKLTDFGLARHLEGTAGLTQSGAPLGTPSYMAPEQAEGKLRDVGPAADTYALGAILYELLTGRPPFLAETAAETLRQVVSQAPVPPSRLNAAVPRDPETICLKCLEKDQRQRYASAAALAEDLQRFQRDEPIVARPVGPAGRVLRWTRRHPTRAALVATALAMVGLAIGGGAWLVQQRAERRAESRSAVGTAVSQALSLRKRLHFSEARELLEEALRQLGPAGPDDLRRQVEQARDDLKLAESLDAARMRAATPIVGRFETVGAGSLYAESLYEETLTKAGLGGPGDDSEAVAARVRDSGMRAEIVAALDDWASITPDSARRKWLLAVARGADPDTSRDRLRQPKLWDDGPGLTKLLKELSADELSSQLTTALGRVLLNTGGDAVPLLSAAQARYPQDFWLNFELGWALLRSGQGDKALGFYRAALALRPEASPVHNGLGVTLLALGRGGESIGHFEQAINIDPDFAVAHNNLASALRDEGRLDEAIGHFEQAIRLDPKGLAVVHINLGSALGAQGRQDEAISHYQESIHLNPKLSAKAHNHIGEAFRGNGQLDEAISHYQESIRLDPNASAKAHNNLGLALWAKGRQNEAIGHYQDSIRLDPKGSARAHANLASALSDTGRLDEAIGHYQDSIRLDPKDSALAHNNLGAALYGKGRLDEAIDHYQESIRLDPKGSAKAHNNLAAALRGKGRLDEAIVHHQESIRLDPKGSALAHFYLGSALRTKNQPHEAIGHLQQALQLDPKLTMARRHLYSCLYAAACAALRGSAGQGRQETSPGEQERVGLRRQALDWLRADLELRTTLIKEGKAADLHGLSGWSLSGWQTGPALADVRDGAALAKLPEAEREEWQRLWADVSALLAADPLDQGLAHAAKREWKMAAGCYNRALERSAADDGHFWFEYAAVLLLSGDRKGYENACAQMVERCGRVPGLRAYHMARSCTLAPDAVREPSLPGRLAETELQGSAKQSWSLTQQGALAYRADRFHEAVTLFEQSLKSDSTPGHAVLNWLWLALAHQRLGETEEARRWLGKATEWLDQYRDGLPPTAEAEVGLHLHNWVEASVLRREAESLIRPAENR